MNKYIAIGLAKGLALALQRQRLAPNVEFVVKVKRLIPKEAGK